MRELTKKVSHLNLTNKTLQPSEIQVKGHMLSYTPQDRVHSFPLSISGPQFPMTFQITF